MRRQTRLKPPLGPFRWEGAGMYRLGRLRDEGIAQVGFGGAVAKWGRDGCRQSGVTYRWQLGTTAFLVNGKWQAVGSQTFE